jgi:hypothetical protein
VARGGHQLVLGSGCGQLIERYGPLCSAAGLPPPQLHPAVVLGGSAPPSGAPEGAPQPQVLLHWGERKPDKGRELALAVLEHLLSEGPLPPPLRPVHWCFHAAGAPPDAAEAALLQRAAAHPAIAVLEGHQPRARMLQHLAASAVALLPYCPQAYAERSSGVLWLYAASRLAGGEGVQLVGLAGGWLEREARALGLSWQALPAEPSVATTLAAIAAGLEAPAAPPTAEGLAVLGGSFPQWLAQQLVADSLG